MSDFFVTIRGPEGLVLDAEIDASMRTVRRLALEDAMLERLLIVSSVVGGAVEAELIRVFEFKNAASECRGPSAAGGAA